MKVKVSQTVEFDELPEFTRGLLSVALVKLNGVSERLIPLTTGDLGPLSLKKIGDLRASLETITQAVEDAQGILGGYLVNAITTEADNSTEEEKNDVST